MPRNQKRPEKKDFIKNKQDFAEEAREGKTSCSYLRWLGTVLGRTDCAIFFFFAKTHCLWHKHLENEIILGGHHARIFRKWVRTLLFSTLLSME